MNGKIDWLMNYFVSDNAAKLKRFYRTGSTDLFYNIYLETVNKCNRKCSYCPISYDKSVKMKKMKISLFHKIIDELVDLDFISSVRLHNYGEPLIDNRLESFIKYIRNKLPNVEVCFATNGDLLTFKRLFSVINAGASRIIFSVHDDIEIPDIKCNYVGFFKPEYWNRAGSLPRTKKTFTFLNKYCRMPLSNFIIRADGKVPLCCNDYSNVVLQGDINKESIMDVWNNPINKKRRKNISKGILLDNICKKCTGMIK